MNNWLSALLALLIGASFTTGLRTAFAHQPEFNSYGSPTPDSAFIIEDIDLSLALFGALQDEQSIDYYRLDVPPGHELEFQLFVPFACETFRPRLAFIGPDVSGPPVPQALGLPPDLYVETQYLNQLGTYFETFDSSYYFVGPTINQIARGGTYYIAVYSTQDRPGTYMLSMGGGEEFSASDAWWDQKTSYDNCEVSEESYFSRLWQRFASGGSLLMVPFAGAVLLHRYLI